MNCVKEEMSVLDMLAESAIQQALKQKDTLAIKSSETLKEKWRRKLREKNIVGIHAEYESDWLSESVRKFGFGGKFLFN
jgi:hypothetical protein